MLKCFILVLRIRMKILFFLLLFFLTAFGDEIRFLEDKNHSYNETNISQAQTFQPYLKNNSNFGFSDATFWLHVKLENFTQRRSKKILSFSYPLLDSVTLYEKQDKALVEIEKKGNMIPNQDFSKIEPNLSFSLQTKANSNSEYYLKISSQAPMNLSANLYTQEAFVNHRIIWFGSMMFYLGAAVIILLYNMMLYFFIRSTVYLYYVLFHTSFLFLVLTLNGFAFRFIFAQIPQIATVIVPLMIVVSALLQMVFFYKLLEMGIYNRKTRKVIQMIIGYSLIVLAMMWFFSFRDRILLANTVSILGVVVPLVVAFYCWLRYNNIGAKFYAIAWLFVTTGIMIEHMKNIGMVDINIFTVNAMQLGALIELFMLSLVLAYRFNNLQNKNQELTGLVVTDSLTKLKNRRYFYERTQTILATLERKSEEYSLVMIDIDHFKNINDTYGHGVGDKVLVEFAKKVTSLLREEDLFARIGGEEFVLLVRSNQEGIMRLTQRLKSSIEEMKISCEKGVVKLTVSMGVTIFKDGEKDVNTLLREADSVLYKAKLNGRNRVEFFKEF